MAYEFRTSVGAVNARQAWRKHVTSLLDRALDRNDATLERVSAARGAGFLKAVRPIWNPELTSRDDDEAASRLESAAGYYAKRLVAAGHMPEVWDSANRAPSQSRR